MNTPHPAPATMGERIAYLRRRAGLSQDALAEKVGVSRQAVSKWETDQCAPDTYNLIALSRLLDASLEYIALGTQPTPTLPTDPLTDAPSAPADTTAQSPEAPHAPHAERTDADAPSRKREKPPRASTLSTRRILGIILLCTGLLSLILGLLLMALTSTVFLLLILAAYTLIIGSILLCPVPQRLLGVALSLALWLVSEVLMCLTTGSWVLLPWRVFPILASGRFSLNFFFALILPAWGVANLGIVVALIIRAIRQRKS